MDEETVVEYARKDGGEILVQTNVQPIVPFSMVRAPVPRTMDPVKAIASKDIGVPNVLKTALVVAERTPKTCKSNANFGHHVVPGRVLQFAASFPYHGL